VTDQAVEILIGVGGFLLLVFMVLAYRLLRNSPPVRLGRTRVGVFLERDRLGEPTAEPPWPELPADTKELPPRR
jgi:hypothetical protein